MLTHFTNNACLVVLVYATRGSDPVEKASRPVQAALFAGALAVSLVGARMLRNTSPRNPAL
jgi:hypothetical protein